MVDYKLHNSNIGMWLLCEALSEKHDLTEEIKRNSDGSYPVKIEVGGVELDFLKVAQRIENSINNLAKIEAHNILSEKYKELIKDIYDIQNQSYHQREKFFKYEDE